MRRRVGIRFRRVGIRFRVWDLGGWMDGDGSVNTGHP